MGTKPAEIDQSAESDLLLPFEVIATQEPYRTYLKTKRNNTFASMQRLSDHWKRYQVADRIWMRELEDLKQLSTVDHLLPAILFIRTLGRIRVAAELAFAGCVGEAADLMRGGIESVAQAHRIRAKPSLGTVWLEKDENGIASEAYKDVFERNKKDLLFKDLAGLHRSWSDLSEQAHSNVKSMTSRLELKRTRR